MGEDTAENINITNPVPEHMIYQENSASGEDTDITFSVDGGETYSKPEDLNITDENGNRRPAENSEYTHIRWTLQKPLTPEENGYVSFKAQLE